MFVFLGNRWSEHSERLDGYRPGCTVRGKNDPGAFRTAAIRSADHRQHLDGIAANRGGIQMLVSALCSGVSICCGIGGNISAAHTGPSTLEFSILSGGHEPLQQSQLLPADINDHCICPGIGTGLKNTAAKRLYKKFAGKARKFARSETYFWVRCKDEGCSVGAACKLFTKSSMFNSFHAG